MVFGLIFKESHFLCGNTIFNGIKIGSISKILDLITWLIDKLIRFLINFFHRLPLFDVLITGFIRILSLLGSIIEISGSGLITSPDGNQWALQCSTNVQGAYRAIFDLTTAPTLETLKWQDNEDGTPKNPAGEVNPQAGTYRAQSFLVKAPNAAEAESNIVTIDKVF